MELATVILEAVKLSEEAHRAYNAGHHDEARDKLLSLKTLLFENITSGERVPPDNPNGDTQNTPQQPEPV